MALVFFQQSSMICIGCHLGGHTLALQHGGQNYFLLLSCLTFDSYAQICCNRYHIIFSTFSLKFTHKICFKKEVIHNFKNHSLVMTGYELTHLEKKVAGLKNQITIIFFTI